MVGKITLGRRRCVSVYTIISDVKVEHSVLAVGRDVGKVQANVVMVTEPSL